VEKHPAGAATSIVVATLPELEGVGGRYFADCNEAELITRTSGDRMTEFSVVAGWALDKPTRRACGI
jgi:hypothetical protein